MRDVLDRYVRCLAERENAEEAPEHLNDLGTFVDWLLERRGYDVLLRAYKHSGAARRKSAGRLQLGVDIVATKADADGVDRLYRFVLKEGPCGRPEFARGGGVGTILGDINEAAGRNIRRDGEDHAFAREPLERVTVVAVHNGDFDSEAAGGLRQQLQERLKRDHDVELEWWDARQLVALAVLPSAGGAGSLDAESDPGLFPPAVRPFVRLALDSLRVNQGRSFDLGTIDALLDVVLPIKLEFDDDQVCSRIEPGHRTAVQARRALGVLTVFVQMMVVESRATADGLTLPALDSLERILVRAQVSLRDFSAAKPPHGSPIRQMLQGLVAQYVAVAATLRERLRPMLVGMNSLALTTGSECIDYPLRVLRLAGYLAVAGLAAGVGPGANDTEAQSFGDALVLLWRCNEAACEGPVTDDQVIELGLVWELLLRLGRGAEVGVLARNVVQRSLARRRYGIPLPAVYQRACFPMSEADVRDLLEAHLTGRVDAIEQGASTILPLAIYLAHRLGAGISFASILDLVGGKDPSGRGESTAVYMQAMRPSEDAALTWYVDGRRKGATKVFYVAPTASKIVPMQSGSIEEIASSFEAFARPVSPSPADAWGFPVIDRMAWKLFRTRTPIHLFVSLAQRSVGDTVRAPSAPA